MKKLILSGTILAATLALVVGGTNAFLNDVETSAGNTFQAGDIELAIDNTSYYNGFSADGNLIFNAATSWLTKDELGVGDLFFNFIDLKPGDIGEDTISLHTGSNEAWACMNIDLTSNDDNGLTEPEGEVDSTGGDGEGELDEEIHFAWWKDDGDNVLEDCVDSQVPNCVDETAEDNIFFENSLDNLDGFSVPLADSSGNGVLSAGPLAGNTTHYIGKAWCFGDFEFTGVPQDGLGSTVTLQDPSGTNGPDVRNAGISCDGSGLDNSTQTDSVTGDITFTATQARHMSDFVCNPVVGQSLTLVKEVNGIEGGPNELPSAWTLFADGPVDFSGPGPLINSPLDLPVGTYTLSESAGPAGYTPGAWTCTGTGEQVGNQITLDAGESATCKIVNTESLLACNARIDLMIVMDNSTSIDGPEETQMKAGANAFVNALTITDPGNHGGLVSFSSTATLSQQLTNNQATLLVAVNAPFGSGNTNLEAGILTASTELASARNRLPDTAGDFPNVMVVITDGNPTASNGPSDHLTDAFNAATAAKVAGTEIYVVGVGADVNAAYLATIASPGNYYSATQFSDLELALLTIANCGEVPMGTLTVNKTVVGGPFAGLEENFSFQVDGGLATAFDADGTNGPMAVTAISHSVTEVALANYTATYTNSVNGNANCTSLLVPESSNVTCNITNTFVPPQPVSLFSDTFGTGGSTNSITVQNNWDEEGTDSDESTRAISVADDSSGAGADDPESGIVASPNGGRFAKIGQDEWICHAVSTAGHNTLALNYYWRGDNDAEDNEDFGYVEHSSAGTCDTATFSSPVATHELDDGVDGGAAWSSLQSIGLPNGITLIRFRQDSTTGIEHFRVDGVSLTGIPN